MIILIGESGSGKDTVQQQLVENFGFRKIVTYTTRPPRAGEVDGETYHFITEEQFREMKSSGQFGETAEYRGWKYASARKDYDDNVVIILTPSGFRKVLKLDTNVPIMSVYVRVPRRERLIRILNRGDDIEEAYRRSLSDVGMFDCISDEVDVVVDNTSVPFLVAQEINMEYTKKRIKENTENEVCL